MKPLSEQVRVLVRQSTTSAYAIAREAGIEKSAMSRFMQGGTLTMQKLDQLGLVLGLIAKSEVSSVPKPLERGRPKKDENKMIAATKTANTIAQEAHTEHFSSHRGFWEDCGNLVYYNNHPYSMAPKLREEENERIIKALRKLGVRRVQKGQHGPVIDGSSELYTTVLVIPTVGKDIDAIRDAVQEEIWTSTSQLRAK